MDPPRQPEQLALSVHRLLHLLPHQWDRKRKLGPAQVLVALMMMVHPTLRSGYDCVLTRMQQILGSVLGWVEAPSASAFSRARRKLSVATIMEVFQAALKLPGAEAARDYNRFKNYRLIAVDGCRIILPATKAIADTFKKPRSADGDCYNPQTMALFLFDVRAKQPVAWHLAPCYTGEQAAFECVPFQPAALDILIFDRGYVSRQLLHELYVKAQPFVMRMTSNRNCFREVAEFMKSGKTRAVVNLRSARNRTVTERFPVTLVKRVNKNGSVYVLATSLFHFTSEEIAEVYRQRWGIETAFKAFKMRFEGEQFHARSPQGVEQEIAAMMILFVLESAVDETARAYVGDTDTTHQRKRTVISVVVVSLLNCYRAPTAEDIARLGEALYEAQRRNDLIRWGRNAPRFCRGPYGRWRIKLAWMLTNTVAPRTEKY